MPDRISFTRPAVERIARVVRAVENARPVGGGLGFRRQQAIDKAKVIKLASFVGPWPKNVSNVVTFQGTGRTANASNLFFPVPGTHTRECAVAKIGSAWHLIDVPFNEQTAVFAGKTATETVFGTSGTTTITFIPAGSTARLNYIGSVAPQSETITFLTSVSASLNTANCTITVASNTQSKSVVVSVNSQTATATSVSLSGTQTATIVSLAGTVTMTMITSTYTSSFLTLEVR
jgi:hypothetical protein